MEESCHYYVGTGHDPVPCEKPEISLKKQICCFIGLFSCFIGIGVAGITIVCLGGQILTYNAAISQTAKCKILQDRYACHWKTGKMMCRYNLEVYLASSTVSTSVEYELCKAQSWRCEDIRPGAIVPCYINPNNSYEVNLYRPSSAIWISFYILLLIAALCFVVSIITFGIVYRIK
jgi:hypothetical protein